MDGREGMGLSGSASYYLNRGVNPGSGAQNPHGFRSITNPNSNPNVRASSLGSTFQVENPSRDFPHGFNRATVSTDGSSSPAVLVKKKKGRPRKYVPGVGANMSLAISPTPSKKIRKGRTPGSGRIQQLASHGEWMNKSAGLAFTPHVMHITTGEDVAARILSFAQQRPRALCILTANGAISKMTLRQPSSSGETVTYEGRFEILCMSGSYLVSENGDPSNRTGGLSISVCAPDGHVIGGAIGGSLIASSLVQVVVCSFVYGVPKSFVYKGGTKTKTKTESGTTRGIDLTHG
ncbi:hypothetical protein LguiA_034292 [Lonicera macranthoides]